MLCFVSLLGKLQRTEGPTNQPILHNLYIQSNSWKVVIIGMRIQMVLVKKKNPKYQILFSFKDNWYFHVVLNVNYTLPRHSFFSYFALRRNSILKQLFIIFNRHINQYDWIIYTKLDTQHQNPVFRKCWR